MRKIMLSILFLMLTGTAMSQETPETPAVEVLGSFSYLRAGENGTDSANIRGWTGSLAANLNHWLGAVAEFSGHYGEQMTAVPNVAVSKLEADTNMHTFLFGPRFSYRWNERFTPFAHTLFGVARVHHDVKQMVAFQPVRFEATETPFAMTVGGGLDLNFGPQVSVRTVQADYLMTRPGGDNVHNLRLSWGVLFRLGSR